MVLVWQPGAETQASLPMNVKKIGEERSKHSALILQQASVVIKQHLLRALPILTDGQAVEILEKSRLRFCTSQCK